MPKITGDLIEYTAFERFRLFIAGELSRLSGWILPEVNFGPGCDDPPEWIIYDRNPELFTYSCTLHLYDMVSVDTARIEPYRPVDGHQFQKTCCYIDSAEPENKR